MAITSLPPKSAKPDVPQEDEDAEESDEYEVADEESEDDEEDEDEEEETGGGMTALLLGSYGDIEDDEDKGWVPDGGREPADYSGDEDEDGHAPEAVNVRTPEKPPSKSTATQQSKGKAAETANGGGKKRAREEKPSEERNGKKTKTA